MEALEGTGDIDLRGPQKSSHPEDDEDNCKRLCECAGNEPASARGWVQPHPAAASLGSVSTRSGSGRRFPPRQARTSFALPTGNPLSPETERLRSGGPGRGKREEILQTATSTAAPRVVRGWVRRKKRLWPAARLCTARPFLGRLYRLPPH